MYFKHASACLMSVLESLKLSQMLTSKKKLQIILHCKPLNYVLY